MLPHFFMFAPAHAAFVALIGGNVAEKPIANPTILAVFSAREDRTSLAGIFAHSNWKLRFARALPHTQTELSKSPVGVVISEACLSDGQGWKDLLNEIQKMEDPPPLIVADRLADERLWAEVLNLGGYDLLAKPFDAKEVLHVVSTACRRRENEQGKAPRKPATSAKRGGVSGTNVRAAFGR
jgi:DNA-binding NtrC family response regulator